MSMQSPTQPPDVVCEILTILENFFTESNILLREKRKERGLILYMYAHTHRERVFIFHGRC